MKRRRSKVLSIRFEFAELPAFKDGESFPARWYASADCVDLPGAYFWRITKRLDGATAPMEPHAVGEVHRSVIGATAAWNAGQGEREVLSATTFEDFRLAFIHAVQQRAVAHAGATGETVKAVNYVDQFRSREFVTRQKDALRHRRSPESNEWVKLYLLNNWERESFHQLTRRELADHINQKWHTKLSPDTLWRLAYRQGLFSSRKPGPKETPER